MSRLPDAIATTGFSVGRTTQLDLRNGGMFGWSPDLTQWVSNQSYIQKNLVAILLEAPLGFQYLQDPAFWNGALKALIETQPKSIEGFNSGLTVETAETPVGGAGEQQQDPTNVTRARTEPVFAYTEKYGRPIQSMIEEWIRMLIMDPDSKVPGISTIAGTRPTDQLADMYGATILTFEPDPTHTKVDKAWLSTNFYPLSTGDITGRRDLTTAGTQNDLSITFSAITQTGAGVRQFAQSILDQFNLVGANPNNRPAFLQAINPDVAAAAGGSYQRGIETLGNTALR